MSATTPTAAPLGDQELSEIAIDAKTTALQRARTAESLQIVFRNLRYTVPIPNPAGKGTIDKTILDGVTGVIQPGRLTVILGSSGAGKTSLLNVLAGESTTNAGRITGELLVNGQSTSGREIRKMAGYVYQDDIILHTMTVREAVTFAARLRIPREVPENVKRERVEDLLEQLSLTKAADTLIGDDRIKGVSGGERKRTSIAMELVTNPCILFLDEPTSGLDTSTSYTVVSFLKQLTEAGHTVVATLHQPSSEIFHMIDDVMLMAEGRIMYMGAADRSVEYFARHGYHCPQYSNPADFFFMSIFHTAAASRAVRAVTLPRATSKRSLRLGTAISGGQKNNVISGEEMIESSSSLLQSGTATPNGRLQQLLTLWSTTPEGIELQSAADNPHKGGFSHSNRKYRSRFVEQFPLLLRRSAINAVRNKLVLVAKLAQMIIFSIIFDLIFWQLSDRSQTAQIQDRTGILFFFTAMLIMTNAISALNLFSIERSTFKRENQSGMYGLPAFFFGKLLVEIPILIIAPTILISATYWAVGLNSNVGRFFTTCFIGILLSGSGMAIGISVASLLDSLTVALAVLPMILMPMMLFGGLFSNIGNMPVWIGWLNWLSVFKYGFVAMAKNEFEGILIGCGDDVPVEMCVMRPGEAAIESLGLTNFGSVWTNVGALVGWFVVFLSLAYFGLWRVTRGARGGASIKKE